METRVRVTCNTLNVHLSYFLDPIKKSHLTPIREFWTEIQILGIELASFLDKKSNKNSRDLILGIESASFLDKKIRT